MSVAVAIFVLGGAIGAWGAWKLWSAGEVDLARRFDRGGAGRFMRGGAVAPVGLVVSCALVVAALAATELSGPSARITAGVLGAGWIGSTWLWFTAIWWGRPSVLLLPAVRDRDVWERVVRRSPSEGHESTGKGPG